MNAWLIFILSVIILSYLLELFVSVLNLGALTTLPQEFEGIFDEQDYKKSQQYTRETTQFALFESGVIHAATILFLLLGGFNIVDQFVRQFGYNDIITGLLFTGVLLFFSLVLSLPFSLYSTFYLEEKFGFNTTTLKTYCADFFKSIVLAIIIGAPLLSLILWFFEYIGNPAWVYCWIAVFFVILVLQFIAPILIMPLFNKFSPLEEGDLKRAILDYTSRENFKIQGVFVMDGSKRSTKLNAFFTGFGRFKKIVFFDTLMEKLTTEQIIAVLAHEMGHYKYKHLLKMMVASFLQTGCIFYFLSLIINNGDLFAAFGMAEVSIYASLVFFGFLYTPISLLLSILFNYFSRIQEYEADGYAVRSAKHAKHLIDGLKILTKTNLSNMTPHPLHVFLHYSHPPVLMRIRAIKKLSEERSAISHSENLEIA